MNEYNTNIEMPVIGCLIMFYNEFAEYIPQLETADFVYCRELFNILKAEYENGNKTDSSIILSKCAERGLGGEAYACGQAVITSQNFKSYFDELKRVSFQRRLKGKLGSLSMSIGDISLEDVVKIIDDEDGKFSSGFLTKAQENLKEYRKNIGVDKERIFTGFPTLDKTLGGLRLPSVSYIGARPSTGKTTFALNIMANQESRRVLFFSLEMSAEMIYERMASNALMIDYNLFSLQKTSSYHNEQINEYINEFEKAGNLFVLDDVYSIEGISAAVTEIKPDLVIIDYVQKITTTRQMFNLREQMEYVSGELKRIAKFGSCHVMALSQIARQGKDAPTMSDLKESGALEADGDYIMLLHRPYVVDKANKENRPEDAQVLLDKNKFGRTGMVDMYFDGVHQRFKEIIPNDGYSSNCPF